MWSFLSQYSDRLNVILNALTLLVWALYFQLLLSNFRRQRRAKILINRSAGRTLSAHCLVSNMSAEAIYLQTIVVDMKRDGDRRRCLLTELNTLTKEPEADPRAYWFQGPANAGEYIDLGSYDSLLRTALGRDDRNDTEWDPETLDEFEFTVVAVYGPDDNPVAAARAFCRNGDEGDWSALKTRQLRSWLRRRSLRKYMQDDTCEP